MTPGGWRARRRQFAYDLVGVVAVIAFAAFTIGYALGDHDGYEAAQREHDAVLSDARSDATSIPWSGAEQVAPVATLTVDNDLSKHGANCKVDIRDDHGKLIGTTITACGPWVANTITIANFTPAGTR